CATVDVRYSRWLLPGSRPGSTEPDAKAAAARAAPFPPTSQRGVPIPSSWNPAAAPLVYRTDRPLRHVWTTNWDPLIETAFRNNRREPHVIDYAIVKRPHAADFSGQDGASGKLKIAEARHELFVQDLTRFHIHRIEVDRYPEIDEVLAEVEQADRTALRVRLRIARRRRPRRPPDRPRASHHARGRTGDRGQRQATHLGLRDRDRRSRPLWHGEGASARQRLEARDSAQHPAISTKPSRGDQRERIQVTVPGGPRRAGGDLHRHLR